MRNTKTDSAKMLQKAGIVVCNFDGKNMLFTKILSFIFVLNIMSSCTQVNSIKVEDYSVSNEKQQSISNKFDDIQASIIFPRISQPIFFLNKDTGWFSCNQSKICQTEDGGESWNVISNQNLENVKDLFFASEKIGWAVVDKWNTDSRSNFIVKTIDGGKSWKKVLEVDSPIFSLSFIDENTGIVSSRWSPIYLTHDGGEKWKEVIKEGKVEGDSSAVREGINYAAILTSQKYIGFGGGIWFSENKGKTWKNAVDSGETGNGLFGASFINDETGWLVGHNSQLWKMVDGKTWERIEVPEHFLENKKEDFTFYRVSFINSEEGWINVHNTYPREKKSGKLLHTKNGGKTWELVYESDKLLGEIKFLNAQSGFATDLGSGKLLRTNDGGKIWLSIL